MKTVYLDNAATTFPKPLEVINAVSECLNNYAVNPRRGHNLLVKQANEQIDLTRSVIAKSFVANPEQLVFIPSATYGINVILQGISFSSGDTLYISPLEHNAVVRCAEYLMKSKDINIKYLPIDKSGDLNIDEASRWFASTPPTLTVTAHASNVSGDILPIKDIIDLTHRYGGKVLIDAAQTVGLHTPSLEEYNYDFLAFSSHKGIYGIPGSGGLVIREKAEEIAPLIYGGTGVNSENIAMPTELPERFETGTHALPSIISMLSGIQWLHNVGIKNAKSKVAGLVQALMDGLSDLGIRIIGHKSAHGNTGIVSFTLPDITPQEVNRILDSEGICVRSGLHCAPLAHKFFGTFPNGTVRISPSYFNDLEEINRLLKVLEDLSY